MRVRQEIKCCSCGELFHPERRNAWHQKYCTAAGCRSASKAQSQREWLKKNPKYFSGAEAVKRTQTWRAQHPGYHRRQRKSSKSDELAALQDIVKAQPIKNTNESDIQSRTSPQDVVALQDVFDRQQLIFIGLIAHFQGSTLQDDIASAVRSLVRLGQDVMGERSDDKKANFGSRASAPCAAPV